MEALGPLLFSFTLGFIIYYLMMLRTEKKMLEDRIASSITKNYAPERRLQDKNSKSRKFINQQSKYRNQLTTPPSFKKIALISIFPALLWFLLDPNMLPVKFGICLGMFFIVAKLIYITRVRKYKTSIEEDLPSTLDLLLVCIEAGKSIDGALIRVAGEEAKKPLAMELKYTFHELNLGVPFETAFRHFGDRCGVPDVQALATSIVQSEKLGISLGDTLRTQTKLLRENLRLRTREKVFKLPVKMIVPIALFIFPSIFAVILGPVVVKIASGGIATGAAAAQRAR